MGRLQGLNICVCSLKRGFLQNGSVYLCECGSIGCGTVLWDWTSAYSVCPLWKSARLLALSPSYWAFSHHKLACMNTSFFCSILKFPQTSQHLSNSGNRKSLFSFLSGQIDIENPYAFPHCATTPSDCVKYSLAVSLWRHCEVQTLDYIADVGRALWKYLR